MTASQDHHARSRLASREEDLTLLNYVSDSLDTTLCAPQLDHNSNVIIDNEKDEADSKRKPLTSDQISEVIKHAFEAYDFVATSNDKCMAEISRQLSNQIKSELRAKFTQHKFIVKVIVGHNVLDTPGISHQCYWDERCDSFATYVMSNQNFYIMATAYALFSPSASFVD